MNEKKRAGRNKTLMLQDNEIPFLREKLLVFNKSNNENNLPCAKDSVYEKSVFKDKIINGNIFDVLPYLPDGFADLIIIDPPYNLTKNFNGNVFNSRSQGEYEEYLASWLPQVCSKLKNDGSLYLCGDWKCTAALQNALEKELTVINRITWQREKGRGAKSNWKNGMEDIWFAVKNTDDYCFNLDAVKLKRRVLAPYKEDGEPKDWKSEDDGKYRLTSPSNFWDDISVPFWSMPENTDHPTQKPEKLYAKLILASSMPGDIIFDPFAGSGTAAVVAKKLGRHFCAVELNEEYCLLAQKRVDKAENDNHIQGYSDGVFWERNSGK